MVFRLLMAYLLDARDNEYKSSFETHPLPQKDTEKPKEAVDYVRENRRHLRSKLAYHALDAILHGRGFSVGQRYAAIRVTLGHHTSVALNMADWGHLGRVDGQSSGICPVQWLALMWLLVQEGELERPELGIFKA